MFTLRPAVPGLLSLCLLVAAAAPAPAPPPLAPPGILDGSWWKMSVSAKGYSVDLTGATTPDSFKTTAYMRIETFVPDGTPTDVSESNALYTYSMFTETAPGTFENTASDHFFVIGLDEDFIETLAVNTLFTFTTADATVAGRVSAKLTLKVVDGALKSGKLKSFSGDLEQSTLGQPGLDWFFGAMKATGKVVPADALPFSP
jgi:hypothetical protein